MNISAWERFLSDFLRNLGISVDFARIPLIYVNPLKYALFPAYLTYFSVFIALETHSKE